MNDIVTHSLGVNGTCINATNSYSLSVFIYSPEHVSTPTTFNIYSMFTSYVSTVSTATFSITSPVATNIQFKVYSPFMMSGSVTGAVSYADLGNKTLALVVNTLTNGGVFTITLNMAPAEYGFYGALKETDQSHPNALNVTAIFWDNTFENFTVNSGLTDPPTTRNFSKMVSYFIWPAYSTAYGLYRKYYPQGETTIYLYVADTLPTTYTINIEDFTGKVVPGTTYLDVIYLGSSGERLIERLIIPNYYYVESVLVTGRSYTRELITSDGVVHVDTFNTGTSLSNTMNIRSTGFSHMVQLAYKYLLIDAMRPTPTMMNVSYYDTLIQTTNLNVTWYYQNNTKAYSVLVAMLPTGTATVTWNAANATTSYRVRVTSTHTTFGNIIKDFYLSPVPTYLPPFSLSFLGTQPWLTDIIPYAIILASAGVFSALTVTGGMFVAVAITALMYYLGWIPINVNLLILAVAIVIIYAIARRKETGMP